MGASKGHSFPGKWGIIESGEERVSKLKEKGGSQERGKRTTKGAASVPSSVQKLGFLPMLPSQTTQWNSEREKKESGRTSFLKHQITENW